MTKIGITGSLASGKTTASNILSHKRGPLFSADKIVKKLYRTIKFKKKLAKEFNLVLNSKTKEKLIHLLINNHNTIKKLEKIIHPLVRKEMLKFLKRNKNKKLSFFEIPLLVESKLNRYFDIIIFIKAEKKVRLKRYQKKTGNKKLFNILNNHQIKDNKKAKLCDHIVVNNKSLKVLKKNLLNIIRNYE